MEGSLKNVTRDIKIIAYKIIDLEEGTVKKLNEARITKLEVQKEELESKIAEKKGQLVSPEEERLSVEQFLNLSKNAESTVKSGDAVQKDIICRFIFLNFTVDEEKVLSYQLKPPFDELLKHHQLPSSRPRANYLELLHPLSQSIRTHWRYITIDAKMLEHKGEVNNRGKNDRGISYCY